MNAYTDNNGIARTSEDVAAWVRSRHGICLIEGFSRMLRTPGATRVDGLTEQVASFLSFFQRNAFYLREDSPGAITWETGVVPEDAGEPYAVAVFAMALGMGSALPQPTGHFTLSLEGLGDIRFCVRCHNQLWQQGDLSLYFDVRRLETCPPGRTMVLDSYLQQEHAAAFGIGFLRFPLTPEMRGKPLKLTVRGHAETATTRFFKLDTADQLLIRANLYAGMEVICQGRRAPRAGDWNVYFGDIHTHSGQDNIVANTGCGYGTIEENYRYARDVSALDFYALTDHDWGIVPSDAWETQKRYCDQFYEPGRFATIPAFEWTSAQYGHRDVYFRGAEGTRAVLASQGDTAVTTPEQMWAQLDALGVPYMTVPHHPSAVSHPFCFDQYNPLRDRLIEIYSTWGSSEHAHCRPQGFGSDRYEDNYVVNAIERGWQVGFVASSDGHDGHPGNAQTPGFFHPHVAHDLSSGWVAVLATELTREAVFDALWERRCYATTGVPIVLSVDIDGQAMGSFIRGVKVGQTLTLRAEARGTCMIERLEVVSGGKVVYAQVGDRRGYDRLDCSYTFRRGAQDEYFYVKIIQEDGEMAWSSPIYLIG